MSALVRAGLLVGVLAAWSAIAIWLLLAVAAQ